MSLEIAGADVSSPGSRLIRLQLARPDGQLVGAQRFNELFTMHVTSMVFLAVVPCRPPSSTTWSRS